MELPPQPLQEQPERQPEPLQEMELPPPPDVQQVESSQEIVEPVINPSPRRYTPPVVEKANTPTIMYGRNGRTTISNQELNKR